MVTAFGMEILFGGAVIHVYAYNHDLQVRALTARQSRQGVRVYVCVCVRACLFVFCVFVAVVLSPGAARRHPACSPCVLNF